VQLAKAAICCSAGHQCPQSRLVAARANAQYNDAEYRKRTLGERDGRGDPCYDMTRHKIIVNPTAGRGAGNRTAPRIEALLGEHGLDFELVRTRKPWHAAELAREAVADRYDCVVAVGGDGTANEVINGLMRARHEGLGTCTMGMLCVGRGNDFAYGVDIPQGLEAGCAALAQGHRRWIDVGHVAGGLYPEGRFFGNGVGIGFDAVVGFEAVKMTWLHGFASYLVAVLKTVFLYYSAPPTTIEYDGQTITQPSLMISIMNGRRMGGGFLMAPDGQPDDGLFDLCIAREVSRIRIFGLIPHFLRGTQASQEPIRTGRARRVVVTALGGALPAHADGETLCTDGQRLEFELLPRQIEVISAATVPGSLPGQVDAT
jgi:diacylglycerol kinase (ATP)